MGDSKAITLRVQGPDGAKRVQISPSDDSKLLYERVKEAYEYTSFNFTLAKDRRNTDAIGASSKKVQQLGLKHGDTVYVTPIPGSLLTTSKAEESSTPMDTSGGGTLRPSSSSSSLRSTSSITSRQLVSAEQDEVDRKLAGQDGLIKRPKDSRLCRHTDTMSCVHCLPLEPYDEAYLKEHNIKHLSFHSYLKKLTNGVDKGKFAALEDLDIRIKQGCTSHPPWPKSICSRCQPSAITLNRQVYRHVDSVMFENPGIVDRFLSYWRVTGFQRVGFLYGHYEEHTEVPLGIRAVVKAIYEPPQESARDILSLAPVDEKQELANDIAKGLGLKCVGWIFSDLIPEDNAQGTVKHIRGINTHFVSAQECATIAHWQNLHPNACKMNSNGVFGSKFATVLVTGDEAKQIHLVGWQVSNQCMALVREKCFLPTRDAPELGYIKESSAEQYVPDVFYKEKNEYGFEQQKVGRPLPVEYLLVEVPVTSPKTPQFTFTDFTSRPNIKPFPVENRLIDGHIQEFGALAAYLNQFPPNTPFLTIASDFHFLLYIVTLDIVPLSNYIGPLLEAIRERNERAADEWSKSEHWATVSTIVQCSHFD